MCISELTDIQNNNENHYLSQCEIDQMGITLTTEV